MISADVKANKTNKKQDLVALSYKLLWDIAKPKIQYEKGMYYFSFDFGWYSIHFDIVCYELGQVFFA